MFILFQMATVFGTFRPSLHQILPIDCTNKILFVAIFKPMNQKKTILFIHSSSSYQLIVIT